MPSAYILAPYTDGIQYSVMLIYIGKCVRGEISRHFILSATCMSSSPVVYLFYLEWTVVSLFLTRFSDKIWAGFGETKQTSLCLASAFLPLRSLKHTTTAFEMVELNARQETVMSLPKRQARQSSQVDAGILNEKVLLLVFKSTNWNPFLVCRAACVCKKLSAIAKRVLWKEFCLSRAPKMVSDLIAGCKCKNGSDRLEGGWHTLARLMFFCGGCQPTINFKIRATSPGHFIRTSRFSKTSGRSFLPPVCRGDTLYVTDPCEHVIGQDEDDVGIFRGIFKGFSSCRTRRCLLQRQVPLEPNKLCPYCRAGVWSMTAARMVPTTAFRRLAAYDGNLEYFICVYGHMHGKCSLLPLSDSDDASHLSNSEDEEPE